MLIEMYLPFHGMCLYMYIVFTVGQFHADADSLVFQLHKYFVWHNNSIRKHENLNEHLRILYPHEPP